MRSGTTSAVLGVVAVAALFLPGGLTWLALGPSVGATATGVSTINRFGSRWTAIVGTVLGSGITLLLVLLFGRIVWLNFS